MRINKFFVKKLFTIDKSSLRVGFCPRAVVWRLSSVAILKGVGGLGGPWPPHIFAWPPVWPPQFFLISRSSSFG